MSYNANAALQCLIIEDVLLVTINTIFQILYAFFIINQCFLYKFEIPIMFLLMFYLQIFIIMKRMFPEKRKQSS